MLPVSPSPRDRLMLMKAVEVGQISGVAWTGCDSRATDPSAACAVVFSRPFQGHLELYREMLQLPAVRWDKPLSPPTPQ